MNVITIVGRVGQDPELKSYGKEGKSLCRFSVADKRGEETTWHNITAFDRLAEICGQFLTKGREVTIIGRVSLTKKDDKQYYNVTATEVVFHGPSVKTTDESATKAIADDLPF